MDFIEFEEPPIKKETHYLWVEKYRPVTLESYIGNQQLKDTVNNYIKKHDIPHLLFYGTPGTGKTSIARTITKNIDCDVMYINASDENGIETVRTKIKSFASSVGFRKIKVIILDESDFLSQESMSVLRNMMETYSMNTRFILTCNYIEKIIPAIVSRCQTYKIEPISKKEVAIHVSNILTKEQIKCIPGDLAYIVNSYYPDIRKILNYTQQSVLNGEIKINQMDAVGKDIKLKILELMRIKPSTAFNDIRQLVADEGLRQFDELYQLLFERVDEYAAGKQTLAILTIAEYLHQSSLVVNKEITFMACIVRLLKELK